MTKIIIEPHHDAHHHDERPQTKGAWQWTMRWITTTNHKDIGTLYLWFSLLMFLVAGVMALVIRAELFMPGSRLVRPEFYNQMISLHGLIMIFGAVMPALSGLANWMIPLMIGAPDMALPRLNNWSFWLLPVGSLLLLIPLITGQTAIDTGWTMYAPLSTTYGPAGMDYTIFAVHVLGLSSIMGAINIIVTIFNMRAKGMTFKKMPIFVWTWLIAAFLIIGVMPVLAGTVTMMLTDRHFGTSFFNAAGGGDPLLFQHLFWFFGHPEVYILILPAFGIVSEIIPTFSRKPLFGRTAMIWATAAIAFLSYIVWVHHMFTTGVPLGAMLFFMYSTMLIAIPTGVKVFNWVATIYRGSISFETPMLFALGFLFMFTIGGFSGLMLAIVPADYQYQDTYFVVAHFHYVLIPGAIFAITGAVYYWLPKWAGKMYNESLGKWHFWLSIISSNVTFFPMHFLGLAGMPRRIPDYNIQFTDFNMVATIGAFVFGLTQLLFIWNIFWTIFKGSTAVEKPWEGGTGLEWTVPSPAPYHTFSTPIEVE